MKSIKCILDFHKWSMYRGFDEIYPHHTAKCLRCGVKYKETKQGKRG